jgi:hypothetical protein
MRVNLILLIILAIIVFCIIIYIYKKFQKENKIIIDDDKIDNTPEGVGGENDKKTLNDIANKYGLDSK